ncbi:hypothetical protein DVH24_000951 [Malus domestica]|uniref:Uncharacterized protein n=1 Tax=Malus domestica TaxID=3750 RepID=A0A498K030_MALDO|nr:hypothetical protein DVH24_000951 [Malus domestica]
MEIDGCGSLFQERQEVVSHKYEAWNRKEDAPPKSDQTVHLMENIEKLQNRVVGGLLRRRDGETMTVGCQDEGRAGCGLWRRIEKLEAGTWRESGGRGRQREEGNEK